MTCIYPGWKRRLCFTSRLISNVTVQIASIIFFPLLCPLISVLCYRSTFVLMLFFWRHFTGLTWIQIAEIVKLLVYRWISSLSNEWNWDFVLKNIRDVINKVALTKKKEQIECDPCRLTDASADVCKTSHINE